MTVDKVTISSRFGDDLTVEQYEEKERGDLLEQEIKELYPRMSGEYARTLTRGYKAKWRDPITKAVSGRYLSPEEIQRRNAEMATKTAIVRKQILHNMLRFAGEWVEPTAYAKGTSLDLKNPNNRGSLSSAVSQIWPFVSATGNMQRREAPAGRGYVYLYAKEAAENPDQIINRLYDDFCAFEREMKSKKRAAARGEDPPLKTTEPAENGGSIPIPGQIGELLELSSNGNGLRVKVDVNFNIRFGLLKE